ncbi:hypothetical protein C0993_003189, partial [Termitomyces sp. T159_Od127]
TAKSSACPSTAPSLPYLSHAPDYQEDDTLTIIMQQLLNKVYMRQHHAPTTIPLQLELVECIAVKGISHVIACIPIKNAGCDVPFADILRQELQIGVPLVTDDFSA